MTTGFGPLNQETYDEAATFITFAKLFPYILEYFVSREDAKQMMLTSNLSVSTTVTVNPGQAVSAPPPTGVGSTVSPGTGSGVGQVTPSYDGSYAHAASEPVKVKVKAKKEAGGMAVSGLTEAIGAAGK
jgi:hypothetical protein